MFLNFILKNWHHTEKLNDSFILFIPYYKVFSFKIYDSCRQNLDKINKSFSQISYGILEFQTDSLSTKFVLSAKHKFYNKYSFNPFKVYQHVFK